MPKHPMKLLYGIQICDHNSVGQVRNWLSHSPSGTNPTGIGWVVNHQWAGDVPGHFPRSFWLVIEYPISYKHNPIGSMYGIYANILGIVMVNVTIYSIHGSYGNRDAMAWTDTILNRTEPWYRGRNIFQYQPRGIQTFAWGVLDQPWVIVVDLGHVGHLGLARSKCWTKETLSGDWSSYVYADIMGS